MVPARNQELQAAQTCPSCGGAGNIRIQQGFFLHSTDLSRCHSGGKIIPEPCSSYGNGSGQTRGQKTLAVKIPAGVDDGDRIRLAGGEPGVNGGPRGDLYVVVHLRTCRF